MIYILIPHDLTSPLRVSRNFGLMEQVVRQGSEMCTVFGYSDDQDESSHIWTWHLGPNNTLNREPANPLLLESLRPLQ
jgi:hypothetical protein